MISSKLEIQETLQALGWGDGSAVHFYDENMRETTARVHEVLGLVDPNTTVTLGQLVKKVRVEGGGLRRVLSCWLRGLCEK